MANVNLPNADNQEQLRQQVAQVSEELNQLNAQFQYVGQQLSIITNYHQDISMAFSSLKEIKDKSPGEKILVPLSSRIFLPVILSEESSSSLLINVGSNVLKKGEISEGIKKLELELNQSKKAIQSLQEEYTKLEREIANRESFLSQFYR
ncbi:MAG: prefoldin subunit alpha [Candidatus Hodarchaeales archaeon]